MALEVNGRHSYLDPHNAVYDVRGSDRHFVANGGSELERIAA